MAFPDPNFLFFFLPGLLVAYYALPHRWRNSVLLLASLVFYAYGGGALVVLLLISVVADYVAGRIAAKGRVAGDQILIRFGILLSVVINLGLLGYFKYANFVVEQLNALGSYFGLGTIAWTSVILPIGISFYTFQSMSYTIDVARGRVEPISSLLDFGLYVSLFPQLIAGPIVRFHEISGEIKDRSTTTDDFAEGVIRFAHGLVKKVIIADAAAVVAESVFALGTDELTTAAVWLGVFAYTIQIYFDFSGYSDMAIGLGLMLGFVFPRNFDRPYISRSITEVWQRWHISLSTWLRDYLYIPLGGNRGNVDRNLFLTMVACGFWHGAGWNYLLFGVYHGTWLVLHRHMRPWLDRIAPVGAVGRSTWAVLRVLFTFQLVSLGWPIFRAESFEQAVSPYRTLLGPFDPGLAGTWLLPMAILATPLILMHAIQFASGDLERVLRFPLVARVGIYLALATTLLLVGEDVGEQYFYFQF